MRYVCAGAAELSGMFQLWSFLLMAGVVTLPCAGIGYLGGYVIKVLARKTAAAETVRY
jgi:hypothetical protein